MLFVKLEAPESVADVSRGGADGLGMVGRQTDVADGEVDEGDCVLPHGEAGLRRAPS